MERFIHVAEIKQKKKSEDLVKVDKNNLHQFERTALLRTNLEVAMLYEIHLNEREAKIDDHIYDFDKKLSTLDNRLEELAKIVEQRHIPASTNKGLLALRQRKTLLAAARDDCLKKLMLLRSSTAKAEASLNRDLQKLKQEIRQKQMFSGPHQFQSSTCIFQEKTRYMHFPGPTMVLWKKQGRYYKLVSRHHLQLQQPINS